MNSNQRRKELRFRKRAIKELVGGFINMLEDIQDGRTTIQKELDKAKDIYKTIGKLK